jgi:hypothetical protein
MAEGTPTAWPVLTLTDWRDTRETMHMWAQVVGKIRMALGPMVNHWWQVPLYVSARGLTTSLMHADSRGLEIEFDFVDHQLVVRATDGQVRNVALEPRSVASFYTAAMEALADIDVHVGIVRWPNEPAGFADWPVEPDGAHYDPTLGEFVLPYEVVRTAPHPDEALLAFCQSTYEAAARYLSGQL